MTVTLLSADGTSFTVDDEDAPLIDRFAWGWNRIDPTQCIRTPFLCTNFVSPLDQREGLISLRCLIMGSIPVHRMRVHTIDGDPRRMEKSNLAWLDCSTIIHRTRKPRDADGVHGVRALSSRPDRWIANVANCHLGTFASKVEAAQVYDKAARERYGVWARLNFPEADAPAPPGTRFPPFKAPLLDASGFPLQVNPEFLPVLSRHRWFPGPQGHWAQIGALKVRLAHLVLGKHAKGGRSVIHWLDGNPQNCRKENLCWQNVNNAPYRGIRPKGSRWWEATIHHQGRTQYFGCFDTPEEAARAYDQRALLLLGPKARLNFPNG